MCILSYLPPSIEVDDDALFNGGISNPDGHGWAIADDGVMYMGKSLDLGEALDGFIEARERHPNGHALFHSRWATHGSTNVANVHPFLVGGSHETVVAHNGILPKDAHPAKGDDRSDTRLFADDILPRRFRRLDRAKAFNAMKQWAGTGNKLVILTVNRRYRHNAYIVNETAGHWDSTGIWHSNYDYTSPTRWWQHGTAVGGTSALKAEVDRYGYVPCVICNYGDVNPATGFCYECRSCQDCMEHERDCMCFVRAEMLERKIDICV